MPAETSESATPLTESALIDVLKRGKYPLKWTFIPGQPGRHLYPSCEVAHIDSTKETDPTIKTYQTVFQISLYARINAAPGQTEAWLDATEREIFRVLSEETLQHGKHIFAESKGFRRRKMDKPYSYKCEARLSIRLIAPGEEGTVIGAGRTLSLYRRDGMEDVLITEEPLELINSGTGHRGRNTTRLSDTRGHTVPVPGQRFHNKYFEYRWRQEDYERVQAWCDYGELLRCEIAEPPPAGSADDDERPLELFLGMPVSQRDSANYQGLKTVVLEMEVSTVNA